MRIFLTGVPAAVIVAGGISLAFAQIATADLTPGRISKLSCSDLSKLDGADQAALVYYAAGYQQGVVDSGRSTASSGTSALGSDLSKLDGADQAALVYYAAGYQQGVVDSGRSTASSGTSALGVDGSGTSQAPLGKATATTALGTVTVTDPTVARSQSSAASSASAALIPNSDQPGLAGLGLDIKAILTTCSGSPKSMLSEIIAANGGAAVSGTGAARQGDGATSAKVGGTSVGNSTTTPALGSGATAPSIEVNNDLNAASQQLNNPIVSNEVKADPANTTSPPAPVGTGGAPATR